MITEMCFQELSSLVFKRQKCTRPENWECRNSSAFQAITKALQHARAWQPVVWSQLLWLGWCCFTLLLGWEVPFNSLFPTLISHVSWVQL